MNSESAAQPFLFARRFLEEQGAVVETSPAGFDALLPQELAEKLGLPEYVRIKDGLAAESEGEYSINYGDPFLEKMVDLCCNSLPLNSCQVSFPYLKSQGFDRLIRDRFSFRNSFCRVTATAPIRTDYLLLACRYVARSDEQKEGLFSMFFHFDTGAFIPGTLDPSFKAAAEAASFTASSRDTAKWERLLKVISRQARELIVEEIRNFRDSMNRRLKRDTKNLEEYYETLKKEMELSLTRAGLSDRLVQDRREKIALLPEELARKKEDLLMKYSIRVKIIPSAALFIRTSAVRILCDLHVGREKKPVSLTYNPLTKALDPLVCEGCGRSDSTFSFCGRRHLLCSRCEANCPVCT
ncbi:MAG: hypothetical protein JW836_13570 [Deltaproteobacteria bacterium]|nr:hypothetical protein [Deltaproteobacteria bacterium]